MAALPRNRDLTPIDLAIAQADSEEGILQERNPF